jgi:hypothetical protein
MKAPCIRAYAVIYCSEIVRLKQPLKLSTWVYYPRGVEPEMFITQTPMIGSCLKAYAFSPQLNLLF